MQSRHNFYSGALHIDRNLLLPAVKAGGRQIQELRCSEGKKALRVKMWNPTFNRLFQLVMLYKNKFLDEQYERMVFDKRDGFFAKSALENFLAYYGIQEDDYSIERGLKQYQRRKKKLSDGRHQQVSRR